MQRTLRDYSHCNMSGAGFSTATDEQLREYVNPGETLSHKSSVGLLFDEMHIRRDWFLTKTQEI